MSVPRPRGLPDAAREPPMPVRVTCPSCGTELAVRDEHAGRAVRCPSCKAVIPPAGAAPAPPPLPPADPPGPPLSVVGPPPLPGTVAPPRPATPGRPGRPAVIIAPSVARSTAPRPAPMPPPLPTRTPPPLPPDPPEEIEITDEAPPPLPTQEPAGEFDFTSAPPMPPRDEDDRPRRRPRRDEEADEDRPRRPRDDREGEGDRPRRRPRDDERDEDRPRRPREETADRPRKPRDEGEAAEDRPRRPGSGRGKGPPGGGRGAGPKPTRLALVLPAVFAGWLAVNCAGGVGLAFGPAWVKKRMDKASAAALAAEEQATRVKFSQVRLGATRAEADAALGEGKPATAADLTAAGLDVRPEVAKLADAGRVVLWRDGRMVVALGFYPDVGPAGRVMSRSAKWTTPDGGNAGSAAESVDEATFVAQYVGRAAGPPGGPPAGPPAGPPIEVSAVELSKAYKADRAAADAKYKGKRLRVEGVANHFIGDGPRVLVTLIGSEYLHDIHCSVGPPGVDDVLDVASGENLTVEGRCEGVQNDSVTLADGRFVGRGPYTAPAVPAAAVLAEYARDRDGPRQAFRNKQLVLTDAVVAAVGDGGVTVIPAPGKAGPAPPGAPTAIRVAGTAGWSGRLARYKPGDPIILRGQCRDVLDGMVQFDGRPITATRASAGPPKADGAGDGRVSAEELYKAYQADKAAADERYKGKALAVTGTVAGFTFRPADPADPNRSPPELVIRLQTGDGSGVAGRVPMANRPPRPPARGQTMTLRGTCDGFDGAAVNLSGCTVETAAQVPPPGGPDAGAAGGGKAPVVRSPSASALILAYSANPETADGRYKGQTVNVAAGVVESVGEDGSVVLVAAVKPPPGAATQYKVKIKVAFETAPAEKPKVGDRVAVRGECAGLADGFVKIEKAELTANKGP